MKQKINTVLFDLDGTLIDTAPDLYQALNYLLEKYQRPAISFDKARPQAAHGSHGLIRLGFQITADDPSFSRLRQEFLTYYENHLFEHSQPFPGILELLNNLEQHHYQWGIVTNKPRYLTLPLLEHLQLLKRSVCLVAGDDLPRAKPHPDTIFHACQDINVEVEQCLFIGDTALDANAAKAANMKFGLVSYGYVDDDFSHQALPHDKFIHQPHEIFDWIQSYH